MKTLRIKWQRLLIDEGGRTCPRCGSTEKELDEAVSILKKSLAPSGIEVILEKKTLSPATFAKDVLESNRIWINEKPLEHWIEAQGLTAHVGQSLCCDVCGNAECRTVEVEEKTYEIIPADLIVKAGLAAASFLIKDEPKGIVREDQ